MTGQTFTDAFEFNDDAVAVSDYADLRAAVFANIQPRLEIVQAVTTGNVATVLGAELGSRVTVTNTTGLYPTEINDDFHIEAIRLAWTPSQATQAQWTLFQEDHAGGSFFRISGAVAPEYGTLEGGDRICN